MATVVKKTMCGDHQTKELIFVCIPCNKLICNRCKKADHEGHKTKDIAKVAVEAHKHAKDKTDGLRSHSKLVEGRIQQHTKRLEDFEDSVDKAKHEIEERGKLLVKWINRHVEKKVALVEWFAKNTGGKEIKQDIEKANKVLTALQTEDEATALLLNEETSDHEAARLFTTLTAHAGSSSESAVLDVLKEPPEHANHIVWRPDVDVVKWKPLLRDYMGGPGQAQTSKVSKKNGVALAVKLICSDNQEAEILGLRVVGNGRLMVVVTTDEPQKGMLKLYNEIGSLVHEEKVQNTWPCKILVSSGKLLLLCTYSGIITTLESAEIAKFLSNCQPDEGTDQKHAYTLKRERASKRKGSISKKKEQHKVYEAAGGHTKHIFTVHAEDPQSIVADSTGKYFAVIQHDSDTTAEPLKDGASKFYDQTTKGNTSLAVFQQPDSNKTTTDPVKQVFRSETAAGGGDQAHNRLTDVSFCKLLDQGPEVLVAADADNNTLLKMEVDGDPTAWKSDVLLSGCPLLDTPTALTTDRDGRLWIGCKGGTVLTLLPKEHVIEEDYLVPRVQEQEDSSSYEDDSDEDARGGGPEASSEGPEQRQTSSRQKQRNVSSGYGSSTEGKTSASLGPGSGTSYKQDKEGQQQSASKGASLGATSTVKNHSPPPLPQRTGHHGSASSSLSGEGKDEKN